MQRQRNRKRRKGKGQKKKPRRSPVAPARQAPEARSEAQEASEQRQERKQPTPGDPPEVLRSSGWRGWLERPDYVFAAVGGCSAAVLAALTAIYAVATGFLWWETKRAVDLARDELVASQRPWVGAMLIFAPNPVAPPEEGQSPDIVFEMRNSGNSPAFKGTGVIGFGTINTPPSQDLLTTTAMVDVGPEFLGPGQAVRVGAGEMDQLDAAKRDEVVSERALAVVWGNYLYEDWLGNRYELNFCEFWHVERQRWVLCPWGHTDGT